ncbi:MULTISPECIES: hypothetical protein [Myroides]|uniref:hypothetical protein n=1 Tax=Myroides TaxID=76831 RepID=UPI001302F5CE|nr:hypothetical protein [Myroides phaeus]
MFYLLSNVNSPLLFYHAILNVQQEVDLDPLKLVLHISFLIALSVVLIRLLRDMLKHRQSFKNAILKRSGALFIIIITYIIIFALISFSYE